MEKECTGFFDNMNHEWTRKFVEHRVADRRILRLFEPVDSTTPYSASLS